jgi:hypothetical protein
MLMSLVRPIGAGALVWFLLPVAPAPTGFGIGGRVEGSVGRNGTSPSPILTTVMSEMPAVPALGGDVAFFLPPAVGAGALVGALVGDLAVCVSFHFFWAASSAVRALDIRNLREEPAGSSPSISPSAGEGRSRVREENQGYRREPGLERRTRVRVVCRERIMRWRLLLSRSQEKEFS